MLLQLKTLADSLYAAPQIHQLFHYTSYDAMLSIVSSGSLWASDIYYLNDSTELSGSLQIFLTAARAGSLSSRFNEGLQRKLIDWFERGGLLNTDGSVYSESPIYVASFTEFGDALGQWRGYTPHGRAVSLGVSSHFFEKTALRQGFSLGRCIYGESAQLKVASELVELMLGTAAESERLAVLDAHSSQALAFAAAKPQLLRAAALFKDDSFTEEREWRLVSSVERPGDQYSVNYRAGRTVLIPYTKIALKDKDGELPINDVFLGPNPNPSLALSSLRRFLQTHNSRSYARISNVPYREA